MTEITVREGCVDCYLVVDLEATCCDDDSFPREEMEVIEIGAVMVRASQLEPLSEFQTFVRPNRHPQLTPYCRELTRIEQGYVDAAPMFPDALRDFDIWASGFGEVILCSWGNYDRTQLLSDCRYHDVAYPFGDLHINLKARFSAIHGRRKKLGLSRALRSVGLQFIGSPHRGIDDARNIVSLLPYIFQRTESAT